MKRRFTDMAFVMGLAFLMVGCFGGKGRPLAELTSTGEEKASYSARRGDTLQIDVWGEPRLSGDQVIREDGNITMPLLNDIPVEGTSLEGIAAAIKKKLEKFVPGAEVSVAVARLAPVRFYLSGNFQKPGNYLSDARVTLLQAIATGGGFAPFADESQITLIRKSSATGEFRYVLDYNRVIDGRDPNPELKDGDFISVK